MKVKFFVTGPGKTILAGWLSDPYSLKEKISERQNAVAENISFDYVLRDGITRKMNAAFLMKQMGIVR